MPAVEVWSNGGCDVVTLAAPRYTIGQGDEADIVVADSAVSHVHALLEQVGRVWLVRDLGSRNGTRVNGERVLAQTRLRHGDEISIGQRARLVFLDQASARGPETDAVAAPPTLTARERQVLVELCRPLLSGNPFTPPATVREIARRLYVGEGAVKQHLSHLYDKFGIGPLEQRDQRRIRLANEALQRGAVRMADLDGSGS